MTKDKKTYHHGDLRNASIDTALHILETEGIAALSLRRVSKQIGVSATATYAHFRNKEAILAEVAMIGFKRLSKSLKDEAGDAIGVERVRLLGVGYVRFAINNRALFRLMFSADSKSLFSQSSLSEEANSSFSIMSDAVAEIPGDSKLAGVAAWSIVHGLSELIIEGRIEHPKPLKPFVLQVLSNIF